MPFFPLVWGHSRCCSGLPVGPGLPTWSSHVQGELSLLACGVFLPLVQSEGRGPDSPCTQWVTCDMEASVAATPVWNLSLSRTPQLLHCPCTPSSASCWLVLPLGPLTLAPPFSLPHTHAPPLPLPLPRPPQTPPQHDCRLCNNSHPEQDSPHTLTQPRGHDRCLTPQEPGEWTG